MAQGKTNSKRPSGKSKQTKAGSPPKALPVTLLSGFLGSGKTTLLKQILASDHGMRIAVIVNDIGEVNVDASLIKQTHKLTKTEEKVIALQNGCICCTLRGDLLEQLVNLAQLQEFDYIIIESSGISEPEQVAESFDTRLADQMDLVAGDGLDEDMVKTLKKIKKAGGLEKFARLDTTATVIDAFTMLNDFDTADMLSTRRDDVTPDDERTVSDLMVDQIEFADVIVVNKMDMVDEDMKSRLRLVIEKLNHRAKVIETSHGKVDPKHLVNTAMFNMAKAQTGYGWLNDLHEMTMRELNGRSVITPKPETEEYNVRNFIYCRQRPFNPRRLWALIYDKFILRLELHDDEEEDDDDDEDDDEDMDGGGNGSEKAKDDPVEDTDMADAPTGQDSNAFAGSPEDTASDSAPDSQKDSASSRKASESLATSEPSMKGEGEESADDMETPDNDTILSNKRAHPIFKDLLRSKGAFWLATRPHRSGDWSQAGAMMTLVGGNPFFCTLDPEDYLGGDREIDATLRHDIEKGGEWGDRRQELVFIGLKLDRQALSDLLDECLLDDAEWESWQKVMRDDGLDGEKKHEALNDLFEDGFPDWADDDGDHDHDHGQEEEGHSHLSQKASRSITAHMKDLEEVS